MKKYTFEELKENTTSIVFLADIISCIIIVALPIIFPTFFVFVIAIVLFLLELKFFSEFYFDYDLVASFLVAKLFKKKIENEPLYFYTTDGSLTLEPDGFEYKTNYYKNSEVSKLLNNLTDGEIEIYYKIKGFEFKSFTFLHRRIKRRMDVKFFKKYIKKKDLNIKTNAEIFVLQNNFCKSKTILFLKLKNKNDKIDWKSLINISDCISFFKRYDNTRFHTNYSVEKFDLVDSFVYWNDKDILQNLKWKSFNKEENNETLNIQQSEINISRYPKYEQMIEEIDERILNGCIFHSISTEKWLNTYKKEIINVLSTSNITDEQEKQIKHILETLKNDLYDKKKENEELNNDATLTALNNLLKMDGLGT